MTIELLLAAGAEVDGRCRCAGSETPLWTAASLGHAQIVRRLLAAGADPNHQDPELTLPPPSTLPDRADAERAQRLLRYLAQPFAVYESFSSIPGQSTPLQETLATVQHILQHE